MTSPAAQIVLRTPTEAENHSYGECLRFDRMRFVERGKGRSGYLSAADEASHAQHARIVDAALMAGVGFDRMAFEV